MTQARGRHPIRAGHCRRDRLRRAGARPPARAASARHADHGHRVAGDQHAAPPAGAGPHLGRRGRAARHAGARPRGGRRVPGAARSQLRGAGAAAAGGRACASSISRARSGCGTTAPAREVVSRRPARCPTASRTGSPSSSSTRSSRRACCRIRGATRPPRCSRSCRWPRARPAGAGRRHHHRREVRHLGRGQGRRPSARTSARTTAGWRPTACSATATRRRWSRRSASR